MSGLLSIAPVTEPVIVQGVTIPVSGVSLRGATELLARFPELRQLFSGREVEAAALIAQAPAAVAAIIAAGIGMPGDAEQEAAAERLGLEAQADLLAAIIKVTLPNGLSAFTDKLKALMGSAMATGGSAGTAPDTSSRKRPKA